MEAEVDLRVPEGVPVSRCRSVGERDSGGEEQDFIGNTDVNGRTEDVMRGGRSGGDAGSRLPCKNQLVKDSSVSRRP